jgi:hypothetical protein
MKGADKVAGKFLSDKCCAILRYCNKGLLHFGQPAYDARIVAAAIQSSDEFERCYTHERLGAVKLLKSGVDQSKRRRKTNSHCTCRLCHCKELAEHALDIVRRGRCENAGQPFDAVFIQDLIDYESIYFSIGVSLAKE